MRNTCAEVLSLTLITASSENATHIRPDSVFVDTGMTVTVRTNLKFFHLSLIPSTSRFVFWTLVCCRCGDLLNTNATRNIDKFGPVNDNIKLVNYSVYIHHCTVNRYNDDKVPYVGSGQRDDCHGRG